MTRATNEWNDEHGESWLWLEVEPEDRPRFTNEVMDNLRPTFLDVMTRRQYRAEWVDVRETLPSVGLTWREQAREQLSGKRVTNQGRRVRVESPRFAEDGFVFTNGGELNVYRALKQLQEKDLPVHDTIGIYPLPGARVPGRSWEPDLLVTYKGRAGVLEIDGPHHNGRRALDATRDHLLRDAGVAFVDRIPVEVLTDQAELNGALRRFLLRLSETR
ncbi:hypothetical protein [Microbispora rosea]|uniref:hypothetical protein n=1 Tax=Microbispora rosea TaxID=58117 RepID=UPI003D92CC3E